MTKLVTLFCTFLYSGFLPKIPGTWGSIASLPLAYFLWYIGGHTLIFASAFIITVMAYYAINIYLQYTNNSDNDPKEIVIDETIGLLITIGLLTHYIDDVIILFSVSFLLFRVCDIVKFFPISYIDKNIKSAWGIILDDIAAAFMAALLYLIYSHLFEYYI